MDFLNGKIYICALNNCSSVQGASEPVTLHAFTVSPEETLPELIVADTSRAETGVPVTPALGVLIGMVAGLALVAVCIILVMRLQHGGRRGGYRGTHIPLQPPSATEPDLIPSNKEIIEEEAAFERLATATGINGRDQFATVARRGREGEARPMITSRGLNRLSYNELTLGGNTRAGYSMVPGVESVHTTWEEVGSHTPLVGQRIVWEGSKRDGDGSRESNV